jgi:hypothetical protein
MTYNIRQEEQVLNSQYQTGRGQIYTFRLKRSGVLPHTSTEINVAGSPTDTILVESCERHHHQTIYQDNPASRDHRTTSRSAVHQLILVRSCSSNPVSSY